MVGVADPDGTLRMGESIADDDTTWLSALGDALGIVGLSLGSVVLIGGACFLIFYVARIEPPLGVAAEEKPLTFDAVLIDDDSQP